MRLSEVGIGHVAPHDVMRPLMELLQIAVAGDE